MLSALDCPDSERSLLCDSREGLVLKSEPTSEGDFSPLETFVKVLADSTLFVEGSACTFCTWISVLAAALGGGASPRRAKLMDRESLDADVLGPSFCFGFSVIRVDLTWPESLSGF